MSTAIEMLAFGELSNRENISDIQENDGSTCETREGENALTFSSSTCETREGENALTFSSSTCETREGENALTFSSSTCETREGEKLDKFSSSTCETREGENVNAFSSSTSNEKKIDLSEISINLKKMYDSFDLSKHVFFSDIEQKKISRKDLGERFAPFFFAVNNWAPFLEKICLFFKLYFSHVSKISECIQLVTENIRDETGYDEHGRKDPTKSHPVTFINFLHAIGFSQKLKSNDAVDKFNSELDRILQEKSIGHMICVLGGIEHFYIKISNFIVSHMDSYLLFEQEHYALHEILDEKHSMDFFTVAFILNTTKKDFNEGSLHGYQMLWNLFNGLVYDN